MAGRNGFQPRWFEGDLPERSYRSLFKWGDPKAYKHPNKGLYRLVKDTFSLTDDHFRETPDFGLDEVDLDCPPKLPRRHADAFRGILGPENVSEDTYDRLSVAYGKTMLDIFRLRNRVAENLPDLVLYPRNKDDIAAIVRYCTEHTLPVYVYGGGSSVTRGAEPVKGGVSLDTRRHFNKILSISETNQTVTVEPGIMGPALEDALNRARELYGTRHDYTCGNFPQSFEYSAVGGWVVTRGAGQNSTYYGKIEDLVLCQEYITPRGTIETGPFPRQATGPDIDQIMIGSEGAYGILVSVTLKIYRHMPRNTRRFSYMFRSFEDGVNAVREIMQSENGCPSVCRLSDPEETDVALKLYGVDTPAVDLPLSILGMKRGRRCLFLGSADGGGRYTRMTGANVRRICLRHGGFPLSGYVTRRWEHGRFRDPYLREDLQDYGIVIDTLECAVNWENLHHVHRHVREYVKSRENTICMTHMSHCYPQGTNLYFIFINMFRDAEDFSSYHAGILEAIHTSGAALSHHHGIGKLFAPWLERNLGPGPYAVLRALKEHFDPDNIMNPGGTLGFD